MDTFSDKMSQLLESLPKDLALMVILSGLSLKPEKIARSVEIAVALNTLRLLDQEKELRENNPQSSKSVDNQPEKAILK